LNEEAGHQVDGAAHLGELEQEQGHAVVVLDAVQAHPGHGVLAGHVVRVIRLVLGPEGRQRGGRHIPLPSGDLSIGEPRNHHPPPTTLSYNRSYSAALRSQDQSWRMPVRIRASQRVGSERYRLRARSTACRNAVGASGTKAKPVAVPAASRSGVASATVSHRPPVARTTGTVPYLRLYS